MLYIQSVHLVATAHDPQNRLAPLVRKHLPAMLDLYEGVSLLLSHAASSEAEALLRELGATVARDGDAPKSGFYIGRKRRQALRLGLDAGAAHLHLCDLDRALHWMDRRPDELEQTVAAMNSGPQRWAHRLRLATEIAAAAARLSGRQA